ncbi:MAG TPA: phospholipase D-like domain-containing protein, partial [Hyphomicrobiaceae bacterium]
RWNREKDRSRRAPRPGWASYETLATTPLTPAERSIGSHRLQMTRTVSEDATFTLFNTRRDDIKRMYRQGIACAERFLYFENQYYKAPEMAEWIVARGRERPELFVILVVLADLSADDGTNPIVSHGTNLQFRTLERIVTGLGPARVRLYTMQDRSVHAKFMLADDSFMTIGSANASVRSFEMDSELNVTIGEPAVTRDFRQRLWAHNLGKPRAIVNAWTEARFFAEWDAVARANSARPAPEMDGEGIVPFDHRTQRGTASPLIPDPIARVDISPDRAFPGFA